MMRLEIDTFTSRGGNVFYKALAHPVGAERLSVLLAELADAGPVALFDPHGVVGQVAALSSIADMPIAGLFGQDLNDIGGTRLGRRVEPVTDIGACRSESVLILAFDAKRVVEQLRRVVPHGRRIATLDDARLPDEFLTNARHYLDPLNFATGFAFFRDGEGLSTRLATVEYWGGYGASQPRRLFARLFDQDGSPLAEWWQDLPGSGGTVLSLDSRDVRERFQLSDFTGQLFLHVVGAAGHDILKYALDILGDGRPDLSCTHDANPWPADYYAGLPAPRDDERVVLWLQNSHPKPIPPGAVRLAPMGDDDDAAAWPHEVAPFATVPVEVGALLPNLQWPRQVEIQAGRHMVRPRYEVARAGRRRIAHVNVERIDLRPDPAIAELSALGKGFLLPFPVLPPRWWRTTVLPTPMAREQADLPLALSLYSAEGEAVERQFLGRLPRDHDSAVDLDSLGVEMLGGDFGHAELTYDLRDGGGVDGWLHAIFRWETRDGRHSAESSFGSHVFNTVLTWRNEPQSYAGPPPGLTTRLFLRLGEPERRTLCHLIYPASSPWIPRSDTALILHDAAGKEIARHHVEIACSGSLLWRPGDYFTKDQLARAVGGYVVVRDTTCRLFGYHGLEDEDGRFCLDHMFGF